MKNTQFILSMALGLALSSPLCRADSVAVVSGTGGSDGLNTSGNNMTLGWQFNVTSAVTVTELGFWAGTGLSDSHSVAIWENISGTMMSLANVSGSSPANIVDGFEFVPVTPVVLNPGNYIIGAFVANGSPDEFEYGETSATIIPGITMGGAAYVFSPGLLKPDVGASFANQGYFGPDFMVAVPEPTTLGLLGLGAGLVAVLRKRGASVK